MAEPKLSMAKALELAKAHASEKKLDLTGHYIDRIYCGAPEKAWTISWAPKPGAVPGKNSWITIKVNPDESATDAQGAAPWGRTPPAKPEPERTVEMAIELATAYAIASKIELSNYHMDRAWLGYQGDHPDRRWIISWSPKPDRMDKTKGFHILGVKLDGTIAENGGAVMWLDARMFDPAK